MNQILIDTNAYAGLKWYGLGLNKKIRLPAYNNLDKFIGTWTAEDLKEFNENLAAFEKIDEDLWR